jgi:hypothetical protein
MADDATMMTKANHRDSMITPSSRSSLLSGKPTRVEVRALEGPFAVV